MDIVNHVEVQHIFFYAMHLPYLKIKNFIANSKFGFYGFEGFLWIFVSKTTYLLCVVDELHVQFLLKHIFIFGYLWF